MWYSSVAYPQRGCGIAWGGAGGGAGGGGLSAIHNGEILDFPQNYNLSKNGGS